MGLFPKNEQYFDQLNRFVAHIHKGATLFVRLFEDFAQNRAYAEQIKEIERECDQHSAAIIERLNTSFITPLDREDIYVLATELDDIMDMINEIARLTVLYGIKDATPAATDLARMLEEAVRELEQAFAGLRSRQNVRQHIDKIRHLEERSDRLSQEAIQRLFAEEQNPVEIIKWLKMYEELEAGLDRCKKVAKVLAGIVVKNA
jgi:predicted phosphate transport protein (TIGR00153 family)